MKYKQFTVKVVVLHSKNSKKSAIWGYEKKNQHYFFKNVFQMEQEIHFFFYF